MRSNRHGTTQRAQMVDRVKGDGPNWILIAGGALLSTLSFRIGFKLKQVLESKGENKDIRGNKCISQRRLGVCQLHSNLYQYTRDKGSCYHCISGKGGAQKAKEEEGDAAAEEEDEAEVMLPLVKISSGAAAESNIGGAMWEVVELARRQSGCSESASISESGSADIYSRREVIGRLRKQLRRRDDMIMEMQRQMADLCASVCAHMARADSAARDLLDSESEIQRLRAIVSSGDLLPDQTDAIAALKQQVRELRDEIDAKDFLIRNNRDQKLQLCSAAIEALERRLEFHHHSLLP